MERAAKILAELYKNLNRFSIEEKEQLLHQYSNLLIALGYHADAISILEEILRLPVLDESVQLNTLKLLGQAHMTQEHWQDAVDNFNSWLEISIAPDPDVVQNLSYAYYQQQRWEEALVSGIEHINLLISEEQEITREHLLYINSLAFSNEDWENAAWVTQIMINEFNNIRDWRNLIRIYQRIDDELAVAEVFQAAEQAGVLEELNSSLGMP